MVKFNKIGQRFFYVNRDFGDTFLKANFAGITNLTRNFHVHDTCLNFYVFEYLKSGHIHIKANGSEYVAGPGDVYILKQGLEVEYFSTDQEQIEKVWFNMHGRLLNHLMEAYNLTDDVIISHCDVEHEIFKIHDVLQSSSPAPDATCRLALYIHELIMKISLSNNTADLSFQSAATTAEQLKNILEHQIYYETSLQFLAKREHTTEKYLIRVFKAKYGITPYAYLIQKRMEAAEELLRTTELSVKDIAAKLTFSDSNYFSRAFKKHTGLSPVAYRRQNGSFNTA